MRRDLSCVPFHALKGLRVTVSLKISGGVWRYEGVIIDTAPREKPWCRYLVRPLTFSPHVFPKWVRLESILATEGG